MNAKFHANRSGLKRVLFSRRSAWLAALVLVGLMGVTERSEAIVALGSGGIGGIIVGLILGVTGISVGLLGLASGGGVAILGFTLGTAGIIILPSQDRVEFRRVVAPLGGTLTTDEVTYNRYVPRLNQVVNVVTARVRVAASQNPNLPTHDIARIWTEELDRARIPPDTRTVLGQKLRAVLPAERTHSADPSGATP